MKQGFLPCSGRCASAGEDGPGKRKGPRALHPRASAYGVRESMSTFGSNTMPAAQTHRSHILPPPLMDKELKLSQQARQAPHLHTPASVAMRETRSLFTPLPLPAPPRPISPLSTHNHLNLRA
eukprot:747126-Hanusia_phi.AAC.2